MIRFELWPENEKRVLDAVRRIQEKNGVQITPTRLVNLLIQSVDAVEFIQDVTLTLKKNPNAGTEQQSSQPKKRKIRRIIQWGDTFG